MHLEVENTVNNTLRLLTPPPPLMVIGPPVDCSSGILETRCLSCPGYAFLLCRL